MLRSIASLTAVMLFASAAVAQTATPPSAEASTPPPQDAAAPKAKNRSDRVICEDQGELGSRLRSKRVCKTAAQWAEQRQQDREWLAKTQVNRSCGEGGC